MGGRVVRVSFEAERLRENRATDVSLRELTMDTVFWILSIITAVGALLAVTLRNLVHCVLSLILFFFGIAAHYFLLRADFLGAVQILIYVGAVAVLILFAIMLTRNVTGTEGPREILGGKWWAARSWSVSPTWRWPR